MDGKDINGDVPVSGTEPLLYPVEGAAAVLGVSPRKVWTLIYADRLRTVWLDGRRLVPADALREFVAGLPTQKPDLTAVSA